MNRSKMKKMKRSKSMLLMKRRLLKKLRLQIEKVKVEKNKLFKIRQKEKMIPRIFNLLQMRAKTIS